METTAVFAEIIVIGIQACVWLALLVAWAFGADWIDLEGLKGWEALATIFAVAVAYTLGVVVDRVADFVDDPVLRWTRNLAAWLGGKRATKGPAETSRARFRESRVRVLHAVGALAAFLEYQRSRQRIARGTLFNLPLILVFGHLFLARRCGATADILAGFDALLVTLSLFALFAAFRIDHAHSKWLKAADDLASGATAGPATPPSAGASPGGGARA